MSQSDDKVVYPKLQGAVNYRSWKQNMISLFKKERAYEIAIGQAPKPAEPVYQNNLTKLRFKEEFLAAQAAAAMTAAPAAEGAPAPPPTVPPSREDIEDAYQSYIQEWEIHEKWIERDTKAYDIMRRHTEDDCKPA